MSARTLGMLWALGLPASGAAGQVRLWSAEYDRAGDDDKLVAAAVDDLGNFFVTGTSNRGSRQDVATLKYDSAGRLVWEAVYEGVGGRRVDDRAKGIALGPSGEVVVIAATIASETLTDYATIKYDGDGHEIWVQRYDGPAGDNDVIEAVAIDRLGNIIVTGGSISGSFYDFFTIKYAPDGSELWAARYDHAGGIDRAHGVVVDAEDNVYVTGHGWFPDQGDDFVTLKYDAQGNQIWIRTYHVGAVDSPRRILIGPNGLVHVTGLSWRDGGTDSEFATLVYDEQGNELWAARYNADPGWYSSNDEDPAGLAVDELGNVYVAGTSPTRNTAADFAIVKYAPDGQPLWVYRFDGEGFNEWLSDMAIDAARNVYVTGMVERSCGDDCTYQDAMSIKVDAEGHAVWSVRSQRPQYGTTVDLDVDGHVYLGGEVRTEETRANYALAKYAQGGPCTGEERLQASCRSRDGGFLVRGKVSGSNPGEEVLICLDGGDCAALTINANGRAKVRWNNVPAGSHVVSAAWACGSEQDATTGCAAP